MRQYEAKVAEARAEAQEELRVQMSALRHQHAARTDRLERDAVEAAKLVQQMHTRLLAATRESGTLSTALAAALSPRQSPRQSPRTSPRQSPRQMSSRGQAGSLTSNQGRPPAHRTAPLSGANRPAAEGVAERSSAHRGGTAEAWASAGASGAAHACYELVKVLADAEAEPLAKPLAVFDTAGATRRSVAMTVSAMAAQQFGRPSNTVIRFRGRACVLSELAAGGADELAPPDVVLSRARALLVARECIAPAPATARVPPPLLFGRAGQADASNYSRDPPPGEPTEITAEIAAEIAAAVSASGAADASPQGDSSVPLCGAEPSPPPSHVQRPALIHHRPPRRLAVRPQSAQASLQASRRFTTGHGLWGYGAPPAPCATLASDAAAAQAEAYKILQ